MASDLSPEETTRLEQGLCVVCEEPLPLIADPGERHLPKSERRQVVAPGRVTCSQKCRAKRYRARRKAGKTSTAESRLRDRGAKEIERLVAERVALVCKLEDLMEQIHDVETRAARVSTESGAQLPAFHWLPGRRLPSLEPPLGEDPGALARELEENGQTSVPGASALPSSSNVSPGADGNGASSDDVAAGLVDPEVLDRVYEALGEDELRALEIGARARLTLGPVERSLAVLGLRGRVKQRRKDDVVLGGVIVWSRA